MGAGAEPAQAGAMPAASTARPNVAAQPAKETTALTDFMAKPRLRSDSKENANPFGPPGQGAATSQRVAIRQHVDARGQLWLAYAARTESRNFATSSLSRL